MLKIFSYLKNPLQKLPLNKSPACKMTTGINHNQENYEANANTLLLIYDSLFFYKMLDKMPDEFRLTYLQSIKYSMIKRFIYYMQNDSKHAFMLHKKITSAFLKKVPGRHSLSIDKNEAFAQMQKAFPELTGCKYALAANEKTSYSILYEIFAVWRFGNQQSSVQRITIRNENSICSKDEQEESVRLTKQLNCDLDVDYKAKAGVVVKTMLDILIGRNKEYKGNLILTTSKDNGEMNDHYKHYQFLLGHFEQNEKGLFSEDQVNEAAKISAEMAAIWASDMTKAAKIISLQEKMIHFMPAARKTNPNFNPNMMAFFPEVDSVHDIERQRALKGITGVLAIQTEPLSANSPENLVHQIIKETLPIYCTYRKPDLSVMSPSDRKFTIDFFNAYFPDYLKNIPI